MKTDLSDHVRGPYGDALVRIALCCATLLSLSFGSPSVARQSASRLVRDAAWQSQVIPTGRFDLASATRSGRDTSDVLVIYIEGDGFAYTREGRRSLDPTPTAPVALQLAVQHPGQGAVAWLARPCQYAARSRHCQSDYWSIARFSSEVIDSASEALDLLLRQTNRIRLILVGYSGGGTLAALLAERRRDVVALVTVAANLDLAQWTRAHRLSPLTRSLDPAAEAALLSTVPQIHFVGGDDTVVDPTIARSFVARMAPNAPVSIIVVPHQDHGGGWARRWPTLSTRPEPSQVRGWR